MKFNFFKSGSKAASTSIQNTLLIDDNELDNFINQKIIEGSKFSEKINVFINGLKALDYIKSLVESKVSPNEKMPELIFLDLNMPIMNGFTFLNELHRLSEFYPEINQIKVAILSSSIYPEDIHRSSQDAYVIEFLHKPLTEMALDNLKKKYFVNEQSK